MAKELIKSLGGTALVANELGMSKDCVRQWASRGLPDSRRHIIAILAAERGIALPADFWEDRK